MKLTASTLFFTSLLSLAACSQPTEVADDGSSSTEANTEMQPTDTETPPEEHTQVEVQPGQDIPLLSGMHTAILHTSKGDITLELNADVAPMAVTNFVMLSRAKLFDNLENGVFKVEPGMLFTAGDISGDGKGASIFGGTFKDENLQALASGDVAMVNDGPNSNGSAFFVVSSDFGAPWLRTFSVFGKVTNGLDIAKEIANAPRHEDNHAPQEPIRFTVEVLE